MSKFVLLVLMSMLATTADVSAATEVCGDIPAGETWSINDSPISVTCDIAIAALTIEPGVVVELLGDHTLVVSGVLRSLGTQAQPVVFRPSADNDEGWGGIRFEDTVDGSEFVWSQIEGATNSGVQLVRSNPTFDFVTFRGNSATEGGAIRAVLLSRDVQIRNSVFVDNFASVAGGAIHMSGPISADGAKLDIKSSLFLRNRAGATTVSQNTRGGAIALSGNARIDSSTFRDNESQAYTIFAFGGRYTQGGAIYASGGLTEIIGTLFVGNACRMGAHSQTPDASRAHGGALNVGSGRMVLTNSVLAQNELLAVRNPDYRGGGLYVGGGEATVVNSTLTGNDRHGVYRNGGQVDLLNTIVFFNNDGGTQIAGTVSARYSNIQNGFNGEGNISQNPVFDERYALVAPSPAIDAGSPDTQYNDLTALGQGTPRNDMGHTGGPSAQSWANPVCYRDADEDGHGSADDFAWMQNCLDGYVVSADDCDDTDAAIGANGCETPGICGLVAAAHWTVSDSPVKVGCDIAIAALTIEPGVVVELLGDHTLVVSGVLRSLGTQAQPVVFRPSADNDEGWGGIRFEDTVDGSEFVWSQIEGATNSGVQLVRSNPTFDFVTFRGNSATEGGAIRAVLLSRDVQIRNSVFVDNFASVAGGAIHMSGPISADGAKLDIKSSLFLRNRAGATTVSQNTRGGAIALSGNARIDSSTFRDNESQAYTIFAFGGRYTQGGAIYASGGLTEIIGTLFVGNACRMGAHSQTPDASRAHGGALNVGSGRMVLTNSVLAQNELLAVRNPDYRGGGLYVGGGEATVVNSTLTGNDRHGVYRNGGQVDLLNTIVFFNNDGGTQIAGTVSARYSNIQNGFNGEGNLAQVPLFRGGEEPSFHLASGSPGIDVGTCVGAPADDIDKEVRPAGQACDVGADEFLPGPWGAIGLATGLNFFAYPAPVPAQYADCTALTRALGGLSNVASLSRYDPTTQKFASCDDQAFAIENGRGYQINLESERSLPVLDSPVCAEVSLHRGFNLVGHAAPPNDLTCFGMLDAWDAAIVSMQRFDPRSGAFETCVVATDEHGVTTPSGVDFQIISGEGYRVSSLVDRVMQLPGCSN